MTDEAIELANRMRDAGPAIERVLACELDVGDRVLYLGLVVAVTEVEHRANDRTRVHYRYGQIDAYLTTASATAWLRLVAEKPTAPGSEPGAAERADEPARNGL